MNIVKQDLLKRKQFFEILKKGGFQLMQILGFLPTLDSGIDVAPGISVAPALEHLAKTLSIALKIGIPHNIK